MPAGTTEKPTVRELMEARGWCLVVCDDTCETQWMRMDADRRVGAYYPPDTGTWQRDLEACQKEYGFDRGESAYL